MRTLVSQAGSQPQLLEAPDAFPAAGAVAIAVEAAGVNPVDLAVASTATRDNFGLPDSVGLGWDVAGTVAAVGDGVTEVAVGDRVAALHNDLAAAGRTHADRVIVPAAAVGRVPDDLGSEDAASVPLNALTAAQALQPLGEPEGRRLLVTGAAGGVGGYAIALAAADGWQVDGLARAGDREFVESTGARLVTDLGSGPYDAVVDPAEITDVATALRDDGDYVSIKDDNTDRGRGIRVHTVRVHPDGAALTTLLARSAAGELRTRVVGRYPLVEHAAAYAEAGRPGLRGRVLLLP